MWLLGFFSSPGIYAWDRVVPCANPHFAIRRPRRRNGEIGARLMRLGFPGINAWARESRCPDRVARLTFRPAAGIKN